MRYSDYKGFTKTYVVQHYIGLGVQESPFEDKEIVHETDDLTEAITYVSTYKYLNNSLEDIESSWYNNHYGVNVNTLSKEGKRLLKEFEDKFEERLKEIEKDPNYEKIVIGGLTIHSEKHVAFRTETPITGRALESHTFVMLDMSKEDGTKVGLPTRIIHSKEIDPSNEKDL